MRSERDRFVGFHATKRLKEAIQAEAKKEEMSVSMWLAVTIAGILEKAGYKTEAQR